jgi:hypothetical protein
VIVHQNKKTNFGSSFYLSKTEGLGMESTRHARCMASRLVRVWHQPLGCISFSPSGLDSMHHSVMIPYAHKVSNSIPQQVADSMHAFRRDQGAGRG